MFRALVALTAILLSSGPVLAQSTPKALVDAWLDAQNRGDFAAYQALYAPEFTGMRRSRSQVVELDRGGWMKDRERMFKKPMVVKADNVAVTDLRVELVQTWQGGSYKDTGRKLLVLTRVGSDLRIVREEQLESVAVAAPGAAVLDEASREVVKLLQPRGASRLLSVQVKPRGADRLALLVFGEPKTTETEARPDRIEIGLVNATAVIARGAWEFDLPLEEGIELTGVTTYTPSFSITPEAFLIAPGEHLIGLVIDLIAHVNGPEDGSVTRSHRWLFRVAGNKVQRVLALQVTEDTGDAECGSGTFSTLELAGTQTAGVADLAEDHTIHTSKFTGNDCKNRYKKSRRIWKWNGSRYAR